MEKRRKGKFRISALKVKTGMRYIPHTTDARGDEHAIATFHVTQFVNFMRSRDISTAHQTRNSKFPSKTIPLEGRQAACKCGVVCVSGTMCEEPSGGVSKETRVIICDVFIRI